MAVDAFYREVGRFYGGLKLITVTLMFAGAIFNFIVLLYVGIDPATLPWTTLKGTGLIALFVTPFLAGRVWVPNKIMSRGLREVSTLDWSWEIPPGSLTERLIYRTGDIGLLWQLYAAQTLAGALFITGATVASFLVYVIEPSIPPLALGSLLVIAISTHIPTKPIVSRWMAIHLHVVDILREQARQART